jgi:hypothetical protein
VVVARESMGLGAGVQRSIELNDMQSPAQTYMTIAGPLDS